MYDGRHPDLPAGHHVPKYLYWMSVAHLAHLVIVICRPPGGGGGGGLHKPGNYLAKALSAQVYSLVDTA